MTKYNDILRKANDFTRCVYLFQNSFLLLPTINGVNLGWKCSFFKKHIILIGPKINLLQLPDLTVQLNHTLLGHGKKLYLKKFYEDSIDFHKTFRLASQSHEHLRCTMPNFPEQYKSCTGLVTSSDRLGDNCSITFTSSLGRVDDAC